MLAGALLAAAGSAEAQESGEPVTEALAAPQRPRTIEDLRLGRDDDGIGRSGSVWVGTGIFGADVRNDSILLSHLDLGLTFGIGRDARVSLDWGVAFASTRVRGSYVSPTTNEPFDARLDRVEARNADLTFEWLPFVSTDVRVGVGLGVAIPVAAGTRLPSSAETQSLLDASTLVHEAYLASNGGWYPWRYRPERVGLYLPLTVAIALDPDTLLSFEGAGGLGFRVLGGMGQEIEGDLMLAADLGSAVLPELRLGLRASVAALALGMPTAGVQPAVEPWLRIQLAPVSILVRGTLGLGGPYGLGSDFPGWGAHAGVAIDL